jgi:hypothetical protein
MPRSTRSSRNTRNTRNTPPAQTPAPDTPTPAPFSTAEVRVGRLPGRIENIVLNGGRKVSDALQGAGLDANGHEIRVNGVLGTMETELVQGDVVLLVRKIKGNR